MKKLLCLLLTGCVLIGCLAGCGPDDGLGGGFRFPVAAEPSALDPQMAPDDAAVTVLCALFEGLTRLDEKGKPVPAAAAWTVSEDGLTYTFTLKESYWSANPVKGKEQPWDQNLAVTADDFLFAFERLGDPDTHSPLADELAGITNVTADDEKTLTVTLSAPDDTFPARMATSPFFPCHRAFFEATGRIVAIPILPHPLGLEKPDVVVVEEGVLLYPAQGGELRRFEEVFVHIIPPCRKKFGFALDSGVAP